MRFDERHQVGAALPGTAPRRVERAAPLRRPVLQLLQRLGADAPGREVDDTQEARVVVRVLQQPQVGQRVLDLGRSKKRRPPYTRYGMPALKSADSITRDCALLR